MSLIIILYLSILSLLSLGFLMKGIGILKNQIDDPAMKRIRFILKAQDGDEVNYQRFRTFNGGLSITMGLLYLILLGITYFFSPNLFGTLTTREIHLMRTCVIAILVLYFSKEICLSTLRETFVDRFIKTESGRYEIKTALSFVVLSVTLIYSIYVQISYPW